MSVGVVMVDPTRIKANASMDQNRSYAGVVREILREAEETDRREDELYGDTRGDELPEQRRTAEGRKAALGDAKRRLEERERRAIGPQEPEADVEVDPESVLGRGGRRGRQRVRVRARARAEARAVARAVEFARLVTRVGAARRRRRRRAVREARSCGVSGASAVPGATP